MLKSLHLYDSSVTQSAITYTLYNTLYANKVDYMLRALAFPHNDFT